MKLSWGNEAKGLAQKSCTLRTKAEKAQVSYDKSASILSDTEYAPTKLLYECGSEPLPSKRIATDVGSLVDINISKKLYLTLDVISTSPLAFLAIVSRLNSTRNLSTLPGAYVQGRPLSKLQEQGFTYNHDIARPRISPNGRFVFPGGTSDCSKNAYPGVWDIAHNQQVVLRETRKTLQDACDALFQ